MDTFSEHTQILTILNIKFHQLLPNLVCTFIILRLATLKLQHTKSFLVKTLELFRKLEVCIQLV